MELLMENKGKVMDNYLFNLKFIVPKIGSKPHHKKQFTKKLLSNLECPISKKILTTTVTIYILYPFDARW